jgi:hypothetical protein
VRSCRRNQVTLRLTWQRPGSLDVGRHADDHALVHRAQIFKASQRCFIGRSCGSRNLCQKTKAAHQVNESSAEGCGDTQSKSSRKAWNAALVLIPYCPPKISIRRHDESIFAFIPQEANIFSIPHELYLI